MSTATPRSLLLKFAAGTLANFYGRDFTFSLLFLQAFRTHGRPFLRQAIHDIDELILLARAQGPRFAEATTASRDALARLNRLQAAYTRAVNGLGNLHDEKVVPPEHCDKCGDEYHRGEPARRKNACAS